MIPKFANPPLQDAEITTRSDIAERAGWIPVVQDEETRSLKRDLDDLLRDMWASAIPEVSGPSKPVEHRTTDNKDVQLPFRLVSTMKRPKHISLEPKLLPSFISKGPECEDSEMKAKARRTHALSAAVEFESLGKTVVPARQFHPKAVIVEIKVPLPNTTLARHLSSLLVTEEARTGRAVRRVATRNSEGPAASPHEPRPCCAVLPVMSLPDHREMASKKRRRTAKNRPPPAYWRPPPDLRGKCIGYALGYPSSWAPDRPYVRDVMKRGVEIPL